MKLFVLLVPFMLTISETSAECSPSQDVCEFTFNIEKKFTMTWKGQPVVASNGVLYEHDTYDTPNKVQVPVDEVITMDGVHRSVTTVNGQIPGPALVVYEGQTLVITINNNLFIESTSVHWHGLPQHDTPFMDGTAGVTQCPIGPGQSFVYKFKASPHGTFHYHSHISGQRVDGLFGALIIKPRVPTYDVHEFIMEVGDWWHVAGIELDIKLKTGYFDGRPDFVWPRGTDGVIEAPVIFKSATIEGRGRYRDPDTGNWTETPLKEYHVEEGEEYRFRVIGTGMLFQLRISVDNHLLQVVSTDGHDVQPRTFESVIINPGERYDFIIKANQTAGNYWIRADTMEANTPHDHTRAILRYNSNSNTEPNTQRKNCTSDDPCTVLNCAFTHFPEHEHSTCVSVDQLERKGGHPAPLLDDDDTDDYFMNFFSMLPGSMGVNGRVFTHTQYSSSLAEKQFVDETKTLSCDRAQCGMAMCKCHHELTLPYNRTIQMVWTHAHAQSHEHHGQQQAGPMMHHPIHLHGHHFHVVKMGYGMYNRTSGMQMGANHEVECVGQMCATTRWMDRGRKGDNVPGLRIENAPVKDTLVVPVGGYAVIRFRSDNPGRWLLHCHIEYHMMLGMSMVINEAPERQVTPPPGFPHCHDFLNDPKRDLKYELKDVTSGKRKDSKGISTEGGFIALLVIVVVGGVLFIIGIAYIVYLHRRLRTLTEGETPSKGGANAGVDNPAIQMEPGKNNNMTNNKNVSE